MCRNLRKTKIDGKEATGLARIKQKISENGLPDPKIDVSEKTFRITLYNQSSPEKLLKSQSKTLGKKLNERQKKLMLKLKKQKKKICKQRRIYENV